MSEKIQWKIERMHKEYWGNAIKRNKEWNVQNKIINCNSVSQKEVICGRTYPVHSTVQVKSFC